MATGKTIALTRRTFVAKVTSLLLNMLSRLVGIKPESPESPELQADSLPLESLGMPNERNDYHHVILPILLVSLSAFLKSPQGIRSERGPGFWWLLLPEMPEEDNIGRRGPHSSTISLQAQQT